MALNSIKATLDKATKAPWKSDYDIEFVVVSDADQDFIAMARNTLPELIKEIERLQKILEDNLIPID